MDLFEEIVDESGLLTETIETKENRIIYAINHVLRVRMSYDDGDDGYVAKYGESIPTVSPRKGKNERYILPVAYGITKSGKKAVRAYQSAGSTRRGVPHWKLFLLDNIFNWSNGKKSFKNYAQDLIAAGLNTNGDKGMTKLIAITPIANDNVQVAKDTNPIQGTPVTKLDVSPSVKSQNPKTTDKEKFVSAQTQRQNDIDINADTAYTDNSKIMAPPTQPVMKRQVSSKTADNVGAEDVTIPQAGPTAPVLKTQVSTPSPKYSGLRGTDGRFVKSPYNFASDVRQFDINSPEWNQEYEKAKQGVPNGPVTKQQVDAEKVEDEKEEKEQIAENFKKFMDRMNNRYKDFD